MLGHSTLPQLDTLQLADIIVMSLMDSTGHWRLKSNALIVSSFSKVFESLIVCLSQKRRFSRSSTVLPCSRSGRSHLHLHELGRGASMQLSQHFFINFIFEELSIVTYLKLILLTSLWQGREDLITCNTKNINEKK